MNFRKLPKNSIIKILETTTEMGNQVRNGAFVSDDHKIISNGHFMVKNIFNGDLQYSDDRKNKLFNDSLKNIIKEADKATKKCKYQTVDKDYIYFGAKTKMMKFNRKFIQTIFQIINPNIKIDKIIKSTIQVNPTNKLGVCKYLGWAIMPLRTK